MTQKGHHRVNDTAKKRGEWKTLSENQNDYSNQIACAIHRCKPSPYYMQEIYCLNNNPVQQWKGAPLALHSK